MAINDDLVWFYSGNGTASGSIGGAIHANAITTTQNENLFNNVGSAEALAGAEKYRCLYIKNNGVASHTFGLYLSTVTPSIDTQMYFGIGTAAIDGAEQSIVDEDTEPTGIAWVSRNQEFNPLSIATLAPGQTKSIWFRRVVSASAGGSLGDYFIITSVAT